MPNSKLSHITSPEPDPELSSCKTNVTLRLLERVNKICDEYHPKEPRCFSMLDFDTSLGFSSTNFLSAECPALKAYNVMFGKMDTSQYLWPITNDERNGSRWITQKKYYHLWREITPNPDKIVEECYVLKLQALTARTQKSKCLERGEKVIGALLGDKELSGKLEEYLKSIEFIYGLLPTKLLDLIMCVSEYWAATDRKFPLIEVKLRILGVFVEEALGIAEDIAKINDKIATVLGFALELQNVRNQPTTDPEIARIVLKWLIITKKCFFSCHFATTTLLWRPFRRLWTRSP